jgi:hypothetical protein
MLKWEYHQTCLHIWCKLRIVTCGRINWKHLSSFAGCLLGDHKNKGTNKGQRGLVDRLEVPRNIEGGRKLVGTWRGWRRVGCLSLATLSSLRGEGMYRVSKERGWIFGETRIGYRGCTLTVEKWEKICKYKLIHRISDRQLAHERGVRRSDILIQVLWWDLSHFTDEVEYGMNIVCAYRL